MSLDTQPEVGSNVSSLVAVKSFSCFLIICPDIYWSTGTDLLCMF